MVDLNWLDELISQPIKVQSCDCPMRYHIKDCIIKPDAEFYDAGRQLRTLREVIHMLIIELRKLRT